MPSKHHSNSADVVRRKPHIAAVTIAVVVLLASGAGYRAAAAYFASPVTTLRLPDGTLTKLPLRLGDWTGQDVPMDCRIAKATDTDQLLSRAYRRMKGPANVSLFIGYGIRLRDLLPHRPEVCYPGNGWTLQETQHVELDISGGHRLPCQLHRFTRGGLVSETVSVLNYYIIDDQYSADVSLLRSTAWRRGRGTSHCAAQVQMSAAGGEIGAESVRDFAANSADAIRSLFAERTSP